MAKIKTSGLVTGITGKLNGSIAMYSGGRTYLRRNAYSQQPNSPNQSKQRNKIVQFSQLWRSYSSAVKSGFNSSVNDYPRQDVFGDTFYLTGYQLANFLNSNLQLIEQPFLTAAPAYVAVNALSTFSTFFTDFQMFVSYTGNAVTNDIVWYASGMVNSKKEVKVSELRKIAIDTQRVVNGNIDLFQAYTDLFPGPVTGKYIQLGYKAVNYSTGNATKIIPVGTILVY